MRKRKTAYYWGAATLVNMALIFVFSSMNADDSTALSRPLTFLLFGIEAMEVMLRKSAHLLLFASLGFLLFNTAKYYIHKHKRLILSVLCTCSLYAVTDELHQLFVPGRACQFTDWFIDTVGAALGILFAYFFNAWYKKRTNTQNAQKAQNAQNAQS